MPVWKSREGRLPAANYYAQIAAYLAQAYPNAKITKGQLDALKPVWDRLWQEGKSADIVAKTTCSCDGKHITASPAAGLERLPKGAVRAPTGVERGQLFDPADLRGSTEVERASRERKRLEAQIEKLARQATELAARGAKTKAGGREALQQKFTDRRTQLASRMQQLRELGQQIESLRSQLSGASRLFRPLSTPKDDAVPSELQALVEKAKKAPKAPKAPKPKAQAQKPAKAEKAGEAPRTRKSPKPAAPAQQASADDLILAKISEALPGIAKTLADSMKRSGAGGNQGGSSGG